MMQMVKSLVGLMLAIGWSLTLAIAPACADDYAVKSNPDPDGIGKVYISERLRR
jgi:hypothetical protein